MWHKNTKNQPLYSEILSKYHLSVVYIVIVYMSTWVMPFFIKPDWKRVSLYNSGFYRAASIFVHSSSSIGTKNQHVHQHYVNFNSSLLIAQENRKERENIHMADQSQVYALKSVAISQNAILWLIFTPLVIIVNHYYFDDCVFTFSGRYETTDKCMRRFIINIFF